MRTWAALCAVVLVATWARQASATAETPSGTRVARIVGRVPQGLSSQGASFPGAAALIEREQSALVQAKIERLVFFTPRHRGRVVDRLAHELWREHGGPLSDYERFLRARWRDFEAIRNRSELRPNDLSTALAFAIVAGYKAYNGDRLSDVTSGSIFRTTLAVQTAAPQWSAPWSNARKQDLYMRWALQGAVLNWLDEDARRRGDAAQRAAVRAQARGFLERQLGRDPDTVTLDRYACTLYQDENCATVVRRLRADFEQLAGKGVDAP